METLGCLLLFDAMVGAIALAVIGKLLAERIKDVRRRDK
jgi:hypothetical protein